MYSLHVTGFIAVNYISS